MTQIITYCNLKKILLYIFSFFFFFIRTRTILLLLYTCSSSSLFVRRLQAVDDGSINERKEEEELYMSQKSARPDGARALLLCLISLESSFPLDIRWFVWMLSTLCDLWWICLCLCVFRLFLRLEEGRQQQRASLSVCSFYCLIPRLFFLQFFYWIFFKYQLNNGCNCDALIDLPRYTLLNLFNW